MKTVRIHGLHVALLTAWTATCMSWSADIPDEAPATLPGFLRTVQASHPFFTKEELGVEVEQKRQDRFIGDQDWDLRVGGAAAYDETAEATFGTPEELYNLRFNAGVSRKFWASGGRLGVDYDYDFLDQTTGEAVIPLPSGETVDFGGPAEFSRNTFGLTYVQPLLQNRGGGLDRLPYDVQGYAVDQQAVLALENQEDFLLALALRFLDWVQLTEEVRIARERLKIANEELALTERKLQDNLVDEVDRVRARDAVVSVDQALRRIVSQQAAAASALATQAQMPALAQATPRYDLYARVELPAAASAVERLRSHARRLRVFDLRLEQLVRERDGLTDVEKARLDLILSGGVKDGDEVYDNALDFDRPNAALALAYAYPLRNRTARADLEANLLQRRQTEDERENVALGLEARTRALLAELGELDGVLDLNVEQIRIAADRTRGEDALYQQGRNALNFVIQSRDQEALAKLTYARNASDHHRLVLRYRELMDELLPNPLAGATR